MILAPIERLPPELIQEIFLLTALDLSMPAASPFIAAKLADPFIYYRLCMSTSLFSVDNIMKRSRQSRLFRFRWMTWDYFQELVLRVFGPAGCICGITCHNPIWPPNFAEPMAMPFREGHVSALGRLRCQIPVKLLHGPWTEQKIAFLHFLLTQTNMTVDWANKETTAALAQGKREAFLARNLGAVELFNHHRRLGKAPSIHTVRFAVTQCGCDRSIVYDTMDSARAWGLFKDGWKDLVLDQWCLNAIAQGDHKGAWLQLKLKELRTVGTTIEEDGTCKSWKGELDPTTGNYEAEGDMLILGLRRRWPYQRFGEHPALRRVLF